MEKVVTRYEAAINGLIDLIDEAREALDKLDAEFSLPRSKFSPVALVSKAIELRAKTRGIVELAEIVRREAPKGS